MEEALHGLVVDDDDRIRQFVSETLSRVGHTITAVASGEEALTLLQDTPFDFAILDLKLGGRVNGQRILEAIRWRWPAMVVVILTAYGTLESALEAIAESVDSFLLKPVRPEALRQALDEAFIRRSNVFRELQNRVEDENVLRKGPFLVDLDRHQACYEDKILNLSSSEFALLVHLMRSAPRVLRPEELVHVVRQYEPDNSNEAREIIKWYVHCLRQQVEKDPANPQHIVNVRGVGYRFAE